MRRWFLIPIALAVAGVALYVLAGGRSGSPGAAGPPLDDIDPASRKRLEQVIEEARDGDLAAPSEERAP